jgi:hypothetical protein
VEVGCRPPESWHAMYGMDVQYSESTLGPDPSTIAKTNTQNE